VIEQYLKRPTMRWSRIWVEDADEGTVARHEGRVVVRVRGRWVDAETGEEVRVAPEGSPQIHQGP
jgi:hypothetical protein